VFSKASNSSDPLSVIEFTILVALMASLSAMSTDMMLPGLATIGENLNAPSENSPQLIVSAILLGLTFGQLFYGPLSDSYGRRPLVLLGFGVFSIGTLICIFAPNFYVLLFGRVLQGFGAAGPRVVSTSIVRDLYSGREMAKILSLMMSFFLIVPAISPSIGHFILTLAGWREIFYVLLANALITAIWFGVRQRETLQTEHRRPFSFKTILSGFYEVSKNRVCVLTTILAGLMLGAFYSFLMSSPQIFNDQFGIIDAFPYYFAALALCSGGVTLLNAKIVMKFGIRKLCKVALHVKWTASFTFLICLLLNPPVSLFLFMLWAGIVFAVQAVLFGNLNAMAMAPVGHMAGIGAAFVATISTAIGVSLGTLIGQNYNGTLIPLVLSFLVVATISIVILSKFIPERY